MYYGSSLMIISSECLSSVFTQDTVVDKFMILSQNGTGMISTALNRYNKQLCILLGLHTTKILSDTIPLIPCLKLPA
jgi:hypothetical protein